MPTPALPRLTLGRRQRIRRGADFARARATGRRLAAGCLALNWLGLPEGEATRLGVITGRPVGGAVARNRARRLMREAFRRHQHDLVRPALVILIARRSIAGKGLATVERDCLHCLRGAGLIVPS